MNRVAGNTDGIGRDSVASWKIVSNNSFPFSQQKLQVLAYVKWEVSTAYTFFYFLLYKF
jgi:hypothetical protein